MMRFSSLLLFCLITLGFAGWQGDSTAIAVELLSHPVQASPGEQSEAETPENKNPDEKEEEIEGEEAEPTEESDEAEADTDESAEEQEETAEDDKPAEEASEEEKEQPENNEKKANGESEEKESSEKDEEEKKRPEPHKVERKLLKIEEKIDGTFAAREMEEVALRPEVWSQFKVVEAVAHGAQVKKGDVLVRFDEEKIQEELDEEMLDQQLGELAMMRAEEEFPRTNQLLEIKYQEAKRKHDQLVEDYEHYKSTDRPFMVRIANYRYEEAKENLASQQEELEQLEKMYEADELTEETEAIVLRRQRFEVETAELILKLQTAERDRTLNVTLPRNDEIFGTSLEEAELALEQAKTAKEMGLTRGRYELEKQRESRARSVERHSKLVADKALMTLRAPTDGTVYYGQCIDGKWSEVASYLSKLTPFGTVPPNKVLMTIVKQRPLYVETALSEKELPEFKSGLSALVVPEADDSVELSGKVTEIATIPGGDKKFAMKLEVDAADAPEWLVAGMNGEVKVTTYENESALVIPTDLVATDEDDEKAKYVMLVEEEDEEPVRRNVKLGREKEKLVEVLEGLEEGDKIVKEEKKERDSKD